MGLSEAREPRLSDCIKRVFGKEGADSEAGWGHVLIIERFVQHFTKEASFLTIRTTVIVSRKTRVGKVWKFLVKAFISLVMWATNCTKCSQRDES